MTNAAITLPPLFPHQERAGVSVRAAWRAGHRRILVVLPTGAGKTIFACSVAAPAINLKGRRALWLAHRRELVDQASASLTSAAVPHGVILSGRAARPELPMQVGSVQTIAAAGSAPDANIIFVDEAHHVVAATWRTIIEAYPHAEAIIGLTATPERGDRSPLGDVFEHMIVGATIRELTTLGTLTPCDVIAPAKYLTEGIASDPLDAIDKHARRSDGSLRRTILFAGTVPEAKTIAARARERGIRAACVDGGTASDERARSLLAFGRGELDLLTNVYVLTEGFDSPGAEVCVIARGCGAASTYLQMVGRVLRRAPGKSRALLIDLRGIVHLHGMPDDDREYSLTGRAIRAAVDLPSIRQCARCGAVFRPVPKCPRCGAGQPPPPPAKVKHAPIQQVTGACVVSFADRKKYFDELVATARARSYALKWVGVRFKQRFGIWPKWPMPKEAAGA